MAALLSSNCRSSPTTLSFALSSARRSCFDRNRRQVRLGCFCSSSKFPRLDLQTEEKNITFGLKECAISLALAIGLVTGVPALSSSAQASPLNSVVPDLSVLISGPPIKDPGALLRYALPINNKAIREVQKPLEDITDSLKVSGVRALDLVERMAPLRNAN